MCPGALCMIVWIRGESNTWTQYLFDFWRGRIETFFNGSKQAWVWQNTKGGEIDIWSSSQREVGLAMWEDIQCLASSILGENTQPQFAAPLSDNLSCSGLPSLPTKVKCLVKISHISQKPLPNGMLLEWNVLDNPHHHQPGRVGHNSDRCVTALTYKSVSKLYEGRTPTSSENWRLFACCFRLITSCLTSSAKLAKLAPPLPAFPQGRRQQPKSGEA